MPKLALLGGTPVADLYREYPGDRFTDDYSASVNEVLRGGIWDSLMDDVHVRRAEEAWGQFNGANFCAFVTNGTHSLQLALEALGVGAFDEVIVPALTWCATASVVCDVNAVPVFADVEPDTGCLDIADVERKITSRTKAIMPVHLYHRVVDMDRLRSLARRHGIAVVEDCAHGHGTLFHGKGLGVDSDFGSYSFQMGKLLSPGEAGALFSTNHELHERILSLRSCGRRVGQAQISSGNFRLTSIQAELLRRQILTFERRATAIDAISSKLDSIVGESPGVRPTRRNPAVSRQCGFRFSFLYDSAEYGGLPVGVFRKALSAELGLNWSGGEPPLNDCQLYQPQLKPRHQLSPVYVEEINPRRWDLPIARRLFDEELVVTSWRIFATPLDEANALANAIEKIHSEQDALLERVNRGDCP